MTDGLYECPSPDCTLTIEGVSDLAEHINENHRGGFRSDDWLSFSNPDTVQYDSDVGDRQTFGDESADEDDETFQRIGDSRMSRLDTIEEKLYN